MKGRANINYIYRIDLPEDVIDKVYEFLRELGEFGIFTLSDLKTKAKIRKIDYIEQIIDYSIKRKIIEPKYWKCDKCDFENRIESEICISCGNPKSNLVEIKYVLIAEIPKSTKEKEYEKIKIKEFDKKLFKRLFLRIERAKNEEKDVFVGFIDIGNSTVLQQKNPLLGNRIKKWLIKTCKEYSYKTLFKYEIGNFIKSMGDSVYIFSLQLKPILKIFNMIFESFLELQERRKANKILQISNYSIYLKAYIAGSIIEGFHETDELSFDLDMPAFTYITRVEKKAQEKLKKYIKKHTLGFTVIIPDKFHKNGEINESIAKELSFKPLNLHDVKDLGDITVYYKLKNEQK